MTTGNIPIAEMVPLGEKCRVEVLKVYMNAPTNAAHPLPVV